MANSKEKTDEILSFKIESDDMVYFNDHGENDKRPFIVDNGSRHMDAYSFVPEFKEPKFQKYYSRIKRTGIDSTHVKYSGMPKKVPNKKYEGYAWEIIVDTTAPSYEYTMKNLDDARYQVNIVNNPKSKQNKIKNFKTVVAAAGIGALIAVGMYTVYDVTYNNELGILKFAKEKILGKTNQSEEIKSKTSNDEFNKLVEENNLEVNNNGRGK